MVKTVDTALYGGRAVVHFHRGRHYYTVSVPELQYDHVYQPGVTTILGIKDKSGPLCWWTAEQCELYGRQKVEQLQLESPGIEALEIEKVLKIFRDMKAEYRNAKKRAAEIGTVVHNYIHSYLEEKVAGRDPDLVLRPTLETMPDGATRDMCDKANASIDAGLEWISKHKLVPMRMETPVWSASFGFIGTDDFIGYVDDELAVCDYKTGKDLYPEVWLQTAAYGKAYLEEHPELTIEARWGINIGKDGQLTAIRREGKYLEPDFSAFMAAKKLFEWDRVHAQGKEPFEIVGSLRQLQAGDWMEELQAEAA